jgi:hypothetical protein
MPGWLSRYSEVRFAAGLKVILNSVTSRVDTGFVSLRVKWQGSEVDHSPPSSAEVKNGGAIPPLSPCLFMSWCLIKPRNSFTFTSHNIEFEKYAALVEHFERL